MLELHAALVRAGNNMAMEWARLELLGIDPATIQDAAHVPIEAQAFTRSRQVFMRRLELCSKEGLPVFLRYRVFVANGCISNPGFSVPTLGLLNLVVLALTMLLLLLDTTLRGEHLVSAVMILCTGVVALSWTRLTEFATYLRILHRATLRQ